MILAILKKKIILKKSDHDTESEEDISDKNDDKTANFVGKNEGQVVNSITLPKPAKVPQTRDNILRPSLTRF